MTEKQIREAVVATAASHIGAVKGSSEHAAIIDRFNDFVKSNTKKIANLPRKTVMDRTWAWCACFASSVAMELGYAMDIIPVEMSCCKMIKEWMTMGRWVEADDYVPAPGDYVYFDWQGSDYADSVGIETTDHVGIVERVDGSTLYTIEGNVKVNGISQVARKVRKVGAYYISGYGIPDYASKATDEEEPTEPEPYDLKLHNLTYGLKGELVRTAQALLNLRGEYGLDTDGSFGPKTRQAVIWYNSKLGRTSDLDMVDGVIWQHLMKGE